MWPAIRLVISLHAGLKCRADVHHDRGPALPNQNAKCSHASQKSPQISRSIVAGAAGSTCISHD